MPVRPAGAPRIVAAHLARRPRPLRTMAAAAAAAAAAARPKLEFLVIVPDKPGVHAKRLEVRPQHLANLAPHVESGAWKMGGALLNSVPEGDDAAEFDFLGSTLVCVAESKEAVLEQLRNDVYTTSGVWDTEKAQIYPFKCAFRNA